MDEEINSEEWEMKVDTCYGFNYALERWGSKAGIWIFEINCRQMPFDNKHSRYGRKQMSNQGDVR